MHELIERHLLEDVHLSSAVSESFCERRSDEFCCRGEQHAREHDAVNQVLDAAEVQRAAQEEDGGMAAIELLLPLHALREHVGGTCLERGDADAKREGEAPREPNEADHRGRAEGYGSRGFPAWGIPPNGGLQFEIEVLSIAGKTEL